MKNPKQEKKEYLISLLKKYGEYDESINRENMDADKIDEIYNVLIINDENERNEVINSYKQKEINRIKDQRKKAEDLLIRTKKLSNIIKEKKSDIKDKEDIQNLENQISDIEEI